MRNRAWPPSVSVAVCRFNKTGTIAVSTTHRMMAENKNTLVSHVVG